MKRPKIPSYPRKQISERVQNFAEGGKVRVFSGNTTLWRSGNMSSDDLRRVNREESAARDYSKPGSERLTPRERKIAETTGDMAHAEFMDDLEKKYPRATKSLKD